MDSFTNSLNSQLQMLAIAEQQQQQQQQQHNQQQQQRYNQYHHQHAIQQLHRHNEDQFSTALNLTNNSTNTMLTSTSELPNDLNMLKTMLEMRVKYTRPKHGEYWEFNNIPNDVRYLQECIKFIDANCIHEEIEVDVSDYDAYAKYLEPLEMYPKELDLEFGTRFYNHYSFKFIRDELIKFIESSNMDYLSNILKHARQKGQKVDDSWIIFPDNKELTEFDYIKFYDTMDDYFKEWVLEYCISDLKIYEVCSMNKKLTTFQVLELLINQQNLSKQLMLLINVIVENSGSEEYLNLNDGFLKYFTYVEHLQVAIETSIPNCENPYRTIMLLMIILNGMKNFPKLMKAFSGKIYEFLLQYPNFTLSELIEFLKVSKMPNLKKFHNVVRKNVSI